MSEILVDGFAEFEEMLKDMTISEEDEKKFLRKAIKPIAEGLKKDTPKGYTGKLAKVKTAVKREELLTVATVKAGAWWDIFQEFGTSKTKKNIGYFDKSVQNSQDEAFRILGEILDKAK